MKRIGTALTIVFIIAGFAISFFIGHYVSDKSHTESRAAQFDKYISRAIDWTQSGPSWLICGWKKSLTKKHTSKSILI